MLKNRGGPNKHQFNEMRTCVAKYPDLVALITKCEGRWNASAVGIATHVPSAYSDWQWARLRALAAEYDALKVDGLFYDDAARPSKRYVAWQKGVDHLEHSVGTRLVDLRTRCPLVSRPVSTMGPYEAQNAALLRLNHDLQCNRISIAEYTARYDEATTSRLARDRVFPEHAP
jgi:hypothetical protein